MTVTTIPQMPGIVKDETPTMAKPRWVDGDGVRFVSGLPESVGGYESAILESFAGRCRALHAWQLADGSWAVAVGTTTKLYVLTGGGLYDLTPAGLAAGLEDGTGGVGFGTGAYGVAGYGAASAADYRPRVWSFANFGPDLLACPMGGTIYRWQGNTSAAAVPLAGAPARVDTMFLDPAGLVVACGANEQASGAFNPLLVRHSDLENITDWTASFSDQAGEFPVRIGSRLVRGLPARGCNLLWTDAALVAQQYTGDPGLVYAYQTLGGGCGLIGPNAATVINGTAFWMGNNGQFWQWSGGAPAPIPCTVRKHVFDHLSYVQADKVVAFSNTAHNEVGWLYPDRRDGNECSRYAVVNLTDGSWSIGTTNRTCRIDADALPSPISATSNGRLYFEERGNSADGGVLAWHLAGSRVELGDGDTLLEIQGIIADFAELVGGAQLYIDAYAFPQSPPITHGPFTLTSATGYLPVLVAARQVALRFVGAAAPARMRLGKLLADVVDTGDRF